MEVAAAAAAAVTDLTTEIASKKYIGIIELLPTMLDLAFAACVKSVRTNPKKSFEGTPTLLTGLSLCSPHKSGTTGRTALAQHMGNPNQAQNVIRGGNNDPKWNHLLLP